MFLITAKPMFLITAKPMSLIKAKSMFLIIAKTMPVIIRPLSMGCARLELVNIDVYANVDQNISHGLRVMCNFRKLIWDNFRKLIWEGHTGQLQGTPRKSTTFYGLCNIYKLLFYATGKCRLEP